MSKAGQELYKKAKKLIPGGTQLLSKRPELHLPELWPAYFKEASGCSVTDLEGNTYLDFAYMGVGTNVLGYADKDVNQAVMSAIHSGNVSTLNAPEEVELAEKLCSIHPWAEQVRFAKTGGEANCIAVRIARAFTGKEIILFCGYHGWHDWYLSANLEGSDQLKGHLLGGLEPNGVPRSLEGTAFPFAYNDYDRFASLMREHEGKIAAVIMEPIRSMFPQDNFLEKVRAATSNQSIPLIFDEISAGFRMNLGGAHLSLGVNPDIAVFGKTLSNGYPMAAVIGRRDFMSSCEDCFISSTYWTDRVGTVASLAFLKKYEEQNVDKHIQSAGKRVQAIWKNLSEANGLEISISGIDALGSFAFKDNPIVMKTLFTQEMLKEGFLASTAFYASYAHKDEYIDSYEVTVGNVFKNLALWEQSGTLNDRLNNRVCDQGFNRLT